MDIAQALQESWREIGPVQQEYDRLPLRPRSMIATTRRDRHNGRHLPVYENEIELNVIRQMNRMLFEQVPMAKAKTRRLIDYTISKGFDWKVTHDSPEIQVRVEAILKDFCENNGWDVQGERDSFQAECTEGEFIAHLDNVGYGIRLNTVEGDNLTEPSNPRELEDWKGVDLPLSWSFGVASEEGKPQWPYYYHFVHDMEGVDYECLPRSQVLHWKRNVPAKAKRGYGDDYVTHTYLGRADKVLARTAEGAAIQASIAYICEHIPNTTKAQAENIVSGLLNVNRRDPITGSLERARRILPGQRVDIPHGMRYHSGLLGKSNSKIYIEVMESLIRLAGTVEAMPEHMMTGYAGNNNRASSLTAESPFIQGRMADQSLRERRLKELFTKVLHLAHRLGLFGTVTWADFRMGLQFAFQAPQIVSRDPWQLTQALIAQKREGWVSDQTASTDLGRDYEQEQELIANEVPAETGDSEADPEEETGQLPVGTTEAFVDYP